MKTLKIATTGCEEDINILGGHYGPNVGFYQPSTSNSVALSSTWKSNSKRV